MYVCVCAMYACMYLSIYLSIYVCVCMSPLRTCLRSFFNPNPSTQTHHTTLTPLTHHAHLSPLQLEHPHAHTFSTWRATASGPSKIVEHHTFDTKNLLVEVVIMVMVG